MKKSLFYYFIKRLFDIISSLLLIIILSWLYIIVFIVNIFVTKGHPLYFDNRLKKNGRPFRLPKFRSMYKDAETHPEKYFTNEQLETWKKERKVDRDPRITPFGRFLRKSSLDELPQVFCIFAGKMSVVGPRPITQKELDTNYTKEEQKVLLSARPGLISNWGVNGRNNVAYDNGDRQRLELEYFQKRSLWYDLKLILKSIGVVLSGKGAK